MPLKCEHIPLFNDWGYTMIDKPILKVNRNKPQFCDYFVYDGTLPESDILPLFNAARQEWKEACELWRNENAPALLPLLEVETPPPKHEGGGMSSDLRWKLDRVGGAVLFTLIIEVILYAYFF